MSTTGDHAALYESYRADHWGGARAAKNARDGLTHELKLRDDGGRDAGW